MISLENLRHRLASADAVPQLAILGVFAGLSTGIVMLLFRAAVQLPLMALLPGHDSEAFEALAPFVRVGLVVGGALILGAWTQRLDPQRQSVGVVHVMERLNGFQGRMPLGNAIVQFVGGAFALLTGQSGGREGPAIHLGAASSSLLGQFLDLPNNSIRTLVACGTAAAIAGSFNTPLAGVIFAMEVIMMEYTIASFIPVILAAVTSTLLSQAVFGNHTAFVVRGDMQVQSLIEYPLLLLEGLLVGCIAGAFLAAIERLSRAPVATLRTRIAIAGVATGSVCIFVPEVMGIGYDTVDQALAGNITLGTLIGIVAAKSFVSAVTYAMRVPVGIIGPTLVIGACIGAALGKAESTLAPELASDAAIYVMVGMGAMMAAVLQAPLAALITVVELTGTLHSLLPAMLAIVAATMIVGSLFKQRSVFVSALEARGLDYVPDPIAQQLHRTAVGGAMQRSFARLPQVVTHTQAVDARRAQPRWIVVEDGGGPRYVFPAPDLARFLDAAAGDPPTERGATIDLESIPATRLRAHPIDVRATLYEAWEELKKSSIEALCVRRSAADPTLLGVLTRDDIARYVRLDR